MPFRDQHFAPETLAMMYRVLDECMETLIDGHQPDPATLKGIRFRLAQLILAAVTDGEKDPEALKLIALQKFRYSTD
jgi:hypothetical protein